MTYSYTKKRVYQRSLDHGKTWQRVSNLTIVRDLARPFPFARLSIVFDALQNGLIFWANDALYRYAKEKREKAETETQEQVLEVGRR